MKSPSDDLLMDHSVTRRGFLGRCASISAAAAAASFRAGAARGGEPEGGWVAMLEDPVRKLFPGKPDLDRILTLYPRTTGDLTADEQVSFPPGRKRADYCLPCQLVVARAARLLQTASARAGEKSEG